MSHHNCPIQLVYEETVVQVYAPPNDPNHFEESDEFYDRQSATLERADIVILMVDLNKKVVADNTRWETVTRKHGRGRMNVNGRRLTELCVKHDHIAHIAVSRRWRMSLEDPRLLRTSSNDVLHVAATINLSEAGCV